jgi:hypothetical protein
MVPCVRHKEVLSEARHTVPQIQPKGYGQVGTVPSTNGKSLPQNMQFSISSVGRLLADHCVPLWEVNMPS